MAIESAIHSRLTNYAGLTALVGQRSYHAKLPQSPAYPAVTYQVVSTEPRESQFAYADSGAVRRRVQLSAWSRDALEAVNVREQLRQAFQRWNGSVSGEVIHDAYIEGEQSIYEDGVGIYQEIVDVLIVHGES